MSNATTEAPTLDLTPAQAEGARDAGLHALRTIRSFTKGLVEGLTPEQWVHQPFDGYNHILWNVGHIATAEGFFISVAGGSTSALPESFEALFGMGSEPKPTVDAYPDVKEIAEILSQVRHDFVNHFQSLDGAALLAPMENENFSRVAPIIGQIPTFAVLHESTHVGQILMARRSQGLPRIMG